MSLSYHIFIQLYILCLYDILRIKEALSAFNGNYSVLHSDNEMQSIFLSSS